MNPSTPANTNAQRIDQLAQEIREVIHGNGKPGLKTDVAILQQTVGALAAEVSTIRRAIWIAAGASAMGAGGITQILKLIAQ